MPYSFYMTLHGHLSSDAKNEAWNTSAHNVSFNIHSVNDLRGNTENLNTRKGVTF